MEVQVFKPDANIIEQPGTQQPLLHKLMLVTAQRFLTPSIFQEPELELDVVASNVISETLDESPDETPMGLLAKLTQNTSVKPSYVSEEPSDDNWDAYGQRVSSALLANEIERAATEWFTELIVHRIKARRD